MNLKKQLMSAKYGTNGQVKKTDANPFDEGDAFQGNLYLRFNSGGTLSISYD